MVGRLLFFCGGTFPWVMLNFRWVDTKLHENSHLNFNVFYQLHHFGPILSTLWFPRSSLKILPRFQAMLLGKGVLLLLKPLRLYVNLYTDCHAFLPKKMCHTGCQVDEVYTAPMKSFSEFGCSNPFPKQDM